jgi:hypothetical protein
MAAARGSVTSRSRYGRSTLPSLWGAALGFRGVRRLRVHLLRRTAPCDGLARCMVRTRPWPCPAVAS